jgi:hypothetical protein
MPPGSEELIGRRWGSAIVLAQVGQGQVALEKSSGACWHELTHACRDCFACLPYEHTNPFPFLDHVRRDRVDATQGVSWNRHRQMISL